LLVRSGGRNPEIDVAATAAPCRLNTYFEEPTAPIGPSLSISHSPVAVRRNWSVSSSLPSGLANVAARSPLMAILRTVAPRCSVAHAFVDGLQPLMRFPPTRWHFTCSQTVRAVYSLQA
jgi:hypothetical protein